VFGYPGGAILPVFDGIHDSPHFDLIIPRHEQGAGHMAEGYARVTGKPGVVLVTSGPGGTNTITPMQDALSDGIPMVVFTGQVPTTARGSDAFQECDMVCPTISSAPLLLISCVPVSLLPSLAPITCHVSCRRAVPGSPLTACLLP
jgi:glyoxylate carboligase